MALENNCLYMITKTTEDTETAITTVHIWDGNPQGVSKAFENHVHQLLAHCFNATNKARIPKQTLQYIDVSLQLRLYLSLYRSNKS